MVRSKHRYISIAIVPVKKNQRPQDMVFSTTDIYTALLSKVKKLHGDFGFASLKTGLTCKYCNEMTGAAVLKMRRGTHKFVSTVIPFITEIKRVKVQLHTVRITSTIRQAYRHLKVYQRKQFEKIWKSLDENQLESVKKKFENLTEMEKLLLSEMQVRVKT